MILRIIRQIIKTNVIQRIINTSEHQFTYLLTIYIVYYSILLSAYIFVFPAWEGRHSPFGIMKISAYLNRKDVAMGEKCLAGLDIATCKKLSKRNEVLDKWFPKDEIAELDYIYSNNSSQESPFHYDLIRISRKLNTLYLIVPIFMDELDISLPVDDELRHDPHARVIEVAYALREYGIMFNFKKISPKVLLPSEK